MEASPFYSHSITMERGVRERHTDDGITAVRNLAVEHESEKRELQSLNEKFAAYLDRVRQLENQNRQLEAEVNEIRKKWGFETADIRRQFDKDLDDLRSRIDDAEGRKALSQVTLKSIAYNSDIVKDKIDFLNGLADADKRKLQLLLQQKDMFVPEMNALESRYRDLQNEIDRLRDDLQGNLGKLEEFTKDLDNVTFDRVRLQNQIQTLKDQLVFLKALYEEEIKEIQNLAIPQFDVSQFYRSELTKAINDIRKDFETLSKAQQDEIQSYYTVRMDEIRQQADKEKRMMEEAKKQGHVEVMDLSSLKDTLNTTAKEKGDLEVQNNQLMATLDAIEREILERRATRDRLDAEGEMRLAQLNAEIQSIRDALQEAIEGNVSLRFEINTYRRLLESQEAYLSGGGSTYGSGSTQYQQRYATSSVGTNYGDRSRGSSWRGTPRSFETSGSSTLAGGPLSGSSPTRRVSHNKRHTGPIDLDENELTDRCITLRNDSSHEVDIGDWYIYQRDGVSDIKYFFPHNLRLRPNSVIRIYSKSGAGRASANGDSLTAEYIDRWLVGPRVETVVHKPDGDEVARIVSEWST